MAEHAPEDLLEQVRQMRVSDLVLDMSMSLISLGFMRLGSEARDLDQARLATDSLRALVPLLRDRVPAELARDLEQALANLQLAYARAAEEEAAPASPDAPAPADAGEQEPAEPADETSGDGAA